MHPEGSTMRARRRVAMTLIPFGLIGWFLVSTAHAQSGGGYELTWSTVDSGGGTSASSDGAWSVSGTVGQPDAGTLSGGAFTLQGGYWDGRGVIVPAASWLALLALMLLLAAFGMRRIRARENRLGTRFQGAPRSARLPPLALGILLSFTAR